jgi:hypothetical protein
MRKTSFYLSDEDAENLRRLAMRHGKSQAELIREGIRLVIAEVGARPRIFRSLGAGHGGGAASLDWNADQLYRKAFSQPTAATRGSRTRSRIAPGRNCRPRPAFATPAGWRRCRADSSGRSTRRSAFADGSTIDANVRGTLRRRERNREATDRTVHPRGALERSIGRIEHPGSPGVLRSRDPKALAADAAGRGSRAGGPLLDVANDPDRHRPRPRRLDSRGTSPDVLLGRSHRRSGPSRGCDAPDQRGPRRRPANRRPWHRESLRRAVLTTVR